MFEIRLHGRGGQGVVTAAELLSVAAFLEGRHAQAFPSFGSERTGAPVVSFCRIDERPIRTREPIDSPDAVIVVDPTLLRQLRVLDGLRPEGWVLVNSSRGPQELGIREAIADLPAGHVRTVPATEIARRDLGRPLPNAALLGAFAALTGAVSPDSVSEAIRRRFSGALGEGNAAAAAHAFAAVRGPAAQLEASHA